MQLKSKKKKKIKSPFPELWKSFLLNSKEKPGQSSVNILLNNPSIVNPSSLKDRHYGSWLSLRKNVLVKQPVEQPVTISIAMVMHYFHPVLEHGLPPSLNLNQNHNAYSIFHAFKWGVKAWHAAHRNILPLPELSEWTLTPYTTVSNSKSPEAVKRYNCWRTEKTNSLKLRRIISTEN